MTKTDKATERRIIDLAKRGTPIRAVADKVGLHFTTVARILNRNGYKTKRGTWGVK